MANSVIRAAVRTATVRTRALGPDQISSAILLSLLGVVSSASAQTTSAQVTQQAASSSDGGDETLQEVVVTGVRFKSTEPVSALKIPIAVKDTPQTVMAVTGDVIDFASIKTFQDVCKVDASGGTSHSIDSFPRNYCRGFFKRQDNNASRVVSSPVKATTPK